MLFYYLAKVRPGHANDWAVGAYIYANVLAYQKDAFGGRTPKTWKDFYNFKDLPGKRTMRKHIDGQLTTMLLADDPIETAEDILGKDLPVIPMWYYDQASGWSDRVTDVKVTPFGTIDLTSIKVK